MNEHTNYQLPSEDILTGLLKANFPTRIAFRVAHKESSRVILDTDGAEKLLGMGDMLLQRPGAGELERIQGAYTPDRNPCDLTRIVRFVCSQAKPEFSGPENV